MVSKLWLQLVVCAVLAEEGYGQFDLCIFFGTCNNNNNRNSNSDFNARNDPGPESIQVVSGTKKSFF
jgi:hypothetical protein